jgi:hypothetical protein
MKSKLSILTVLTVCALLLILAGCESAQMTQATEPVVEPQPIEEPAIDIESETEPQLEEPIKVVEPEIVVPKIAEITFENTVHDFGEILNKSKNTCEFKFENTGTGRLEIGNIKRTCGCTVFELSKKDYEPGESGKIKVEYSASSRPGTSMKHLYVPSNAQNNPKVELTIKADIVLKVKASPQILNLTLNKENAGCPPITLTSTDGKPFAITNFHSTNEIITAKFEPNVSASEFVLHPEVDIEKLSKRLNGHISIRLTHPQCNSLGISYRTPPQFQTNPATIIIQSASPTEPIKKKVLVQSNYGGNFEIESVYSEKGSLKLLSQKKLEDGIELEVQIDPPQQARKVRFFTDWLYIQIKGGERVQVHANMWFAKAN